jgi:hypothetical protein
MDSQTLNVINENQPQVASAMDEATAIEQLPIPPPAETHAMTTAVQQSPLPNTPLITPRPPTPTMSQTREQPADL